MASGTTPGMPPPGRSSAPAAARCCWCVQEAGHSGNRGSRTGVIMSDGPDAFIFDLDGVITFTARVHAAAWKELFDTFLRGWSEKSGEPFQPFRESDYYAYVDGKPRYDGVLSFLRSRGIHLPY